MLLHINADVTYKSSFWLLLSHSTSLYAKAKTFAVQASKAEREKKNCFSSFHLSTHSHTYRTCVQTVGCRRDFIAKPYECAFLSIRETMCVYVMQISSISLNRVSLFFFCKSFLPHIDLATLSPSISLHLSVYICNGGIIVAVVILLSIAM